MNYIERVFLNTDKSYIVAKKDYEEAILILCARILNGLNREWVVRKLKPATLMFGRGITELSTMQFLQWPDFLVDAVMKMEQYTNYWRDACPEDFQLGDRQ